MRAIYVGLACVVALAPRQSQASECSVAKVLFGDVQLDTVSPGDEALVRHSGFKSAELNGAIRGTIARERGSFAVYDAAGYAVGRIAPSGEITGSDEACSTAPMRLVRSGEGVSVIMVGKSPVGTVTGKLPR